MKGSHTSKELVHGFIKVIPNPEIGSAHGPRLKRIYRLTYETRQMRQKVNNERKPHGNERY